jgi:hypothetical protein
MYGIYSFKIIVHTKSVTGIATDMSNQKVFTSALDGQIKVSEWIV